MDIDFLIDFGSSCNFVSEQIWKENKTKYIIEKKWGIFQKLFGYDSKVPLKIYGKFTTTKVSTREEVIKLYVVRGNDQSLFRHLHLHSVTILYRLFLK